MEMWCPDDIGRDSWDWVGPPAWGRACFNSPEWGGSSSPVKTEPPQIVLLLLLLLWLLWWWCVVVVVVVVVVRTFSLYDVSIHATQQYAPNSRWQVTWKSDSWRPRHPEPSTTRNSSSSRAPKNSSGQCPDGEQVTARNKGLMKIISRSMQIQQAKHHLCDFSVLRPAKSKATQGEVHRNQQNQ